MLKRSPVSVGAQIPQNVAEANIAELQAFVTDSDLVNLPLALNAAGAFLRIQPALRPAIDRQIMLSAIRTLRSPLVTGVALDAIFALVAARIDLDRSAINDLVSTMTAPDVIGSHGPLSAGQKSGLHVFANVAKCTGVIVSRAGPDAQHLIRNLGTQLKVRLLMGCRSQPSDCAPFAELKDCRNKPVLGFADAG